jgi:lysophospholipase L1-like esterase
MSKEGQRTNFSGFGYVEPSGIFTRDRLALMFNGSQSNADAGTEDVIQFPQVAALAPAQSFAFGLWYVPYDVINARTLAGAVNVGSLNSRWSIRTGSSQQLLVVFYTPNTDTFAGDIIGSQTGVIAYNRPVMVGFNYGGNLGNNQLVVNGTIDGSSTVGGSIPNTLTAGAGAAPIELGREHNQGTGTSIPASGRIWGAFFFNRILSAGDWSNLYNERWDLLPKNSDGTVQGLVSWWPLDGDLRDRISGYDGTQRPAAPAGPKFINAVSTAAPGAIAGAKRVLPLGDSITSGTGYPGGWRPACAMEMFARYKKPITFIGLQNDPGRIACSATSVTSNSCTYTVPSGHGVVAGNMISTYGFSVNAQAAIVTSTTATTIVAPLTAANGSQGTGTICVEPQWWNDGAHGSHSGISGQTLANIQGRVAAELAVAIPDAVVIQGGINDAVTNNVVLTSSIQGILDALDTNGLPKATPVIVLNLETHNTATLAAMITIYNRQLANWITAYRSQVQRNIEMLDIASSLLMPGDYQADLIHFSQSGFEKLGVLIASKLASMF